MVHPKVRDHFKTFSPLLWWKLLLDIQHQLSGGPSCFEETESGYLKSMFQGLNFVLGNIDSELSLDYLKNLHKHSTSHIQDQHPIEPQNEHRLKQVIDTYNTSIKITTTSEEKIKAISACIQELAFTHPYYSNNGKTRILLLLLKLLIQNDLSPALLFEIDKLDAFSIDTLIRAQTSFKFACLIDKNYSNEVILYLENNEFLIAVVAEQLARHIHLWYDLDSTAKNAFFDIVLEVLQNKKSFTCLEFQLLVQNIEDCARQTIISLSPVTMDMSLFKKNIQDKNLICSKPSLFNSIYNFAWNSTFGFFYEQSPHSTIIHACHQHISTPDSLLHKRI